MSANKTTKNKLIMRFGKRCFIEELGLRTKQEIQEEMKQYKSKGQRRRMDELTYHHIIARCDGGATNECNGAIIRTINHAWLHRLPLENQEKINQLIIQYKLKFYTEAEIENTYAGSCNNFSTEAKRKGGYGKMRKNHKLVPLSKEAKEWINKNYKEWLKDVK